MRLWLAQSWADQVGRKGGASTAGQHLAPAGCHRRATPRRATTGEVHATETLEGEAAVAVHRGPYNRLNEAYKAIDQWLRANGRESAGDVWEIYGDPTPDPADTETTVVHLLE